ncbi:HEPN domain-containing protein [Mesorhizobium intechi]|uniref:HEPN domain-containing protein n=1 Tax=Mesorhizobium intechi TaxID=537601 RepID=A0A8T9AKW6_9HYPH|nr:HEPN domain-containing protein [Mesorhizobium intechi]TSE04263.1 HEPN domain-containing protein [Mesorhizobium intechi]
MSNGGEILLAKQIDDFAFRTFRDVADCDYVSARLSHRAKLYAQFLWQAQQAIEKYLKCILLLNRIPAAHVKHDINKGLLAAKKLPFDVKTSNGPDAFLQYLNRFGPWRYLESSYFAKGLELQMLDKTVWEIRRFCQNLQVRDPQHHDRFLGLVSDKLSAISKSDDLPPQDFKLQGGRLEKIVDDRSNRARTALIWQNLFYGIRRRDRLANVDNSFHATNSPLWLHPELVDHLVPFVYLPNHVAAAYREQAREKARAPATK